LNEINEFQPRVFDDSDHKTWYCLKSIVVEKINSIDNNRRVFNVVDGQGLLITIFLVLYYLNQDYIIERRDKIFKLDFQVSQGISTFLNFINAASFNEEEGDSYRIYNAYTKIKQWLDSRVDPIDKMNFRSKFIFCTKVIWFKCNEEN
jgi:hypothetical protein